MRRMAPPYMHEAIDDLQMTIYEETASLCNLSILRL
jgi:hypothetical protein